MWLPCRLRTSLPAKLVLEQCPVLPFILNKWDSRARHRERGGGSIYALYRAAGRKRRDSKYIALGNVTRPESAEGDGPPTSAELSRS